jgi:hypothetical protein
LAVHVPDPDRTGGEGAAVKVFLAKRARCGTGGNIFFEFQVGLLQFLFGIAGSQSSIE